MPRRVCRGGDVAAEQRIISPEVSITHGIVNGEQHHEVESLLLFLCHIRL
jgi:hypothetical protein